MRDDDDDERTRRHVAGTVETRHQHERRAASRRMHRFAINDSGSE